MAFFIILFLIIGFIVGLATRETRKSDAYAIYILVSLAWAFAWGPFAILTFLELAGGDHVARRIKKRFSKTPIEELLKDTDVHEAAKVPTVKPKQIAKVEPAKLPKPSKSTVTKTKQLKIALISRSMELSAATPALKRFPHIKNVFENLKHLSDAMVCMLEVHESYFSLDLVVKDNSRPLDPDMAFKEIHSMVNEFKDLLSDLVENPIDHLKDDLSNKEKATLKRITNGKCFRDKITAFVDRHGLTLEQELSDKRKELMADAQPMLTNMHKMMSSLNELNESLGGDKIKYEIVTLEAKFTTAKESIERYIRPAPKPIKDSTKQNVVPNPPLSSAKNTGITSVSNAKAEVETATTKTLDNKPRKAPPNTLHIGHSERNPQSRINTFSGLLKHLVFENFVTSESLALPGTIQTVTLISSAVSKFVTTEPISQISIQKYRYSNLRMVAACKNLIVENTSSEIDVSGLISLTTTSLHIANSEVKNASKSLSGNNLRTISLAHIKDLTELKLLDNGNRNLEKVTIRSCPNLVTIFSPLTALRSLETIDVIASPKFQLPTDISNAKNLVRAPEYLNQNKTLPTVPGMFLEIFTSYHDANVAAKDHAQKGKFVKVKRYGRLCVLASGDTLLSLTESQVETLYLLREQYMSIDETADYKTLSSKTILGHACDLIARNYAKLDDFCHNIQLTPNDQTLIFNNLLTQAKDDKTISTKEVMDLYREKVPGLFYSDLQLMKAEVKRVNGYLNQVNKN
ncbi:hypothetical protein [Vibrio barjaei]|uniref:hypothetical protein n=1 Tax=Vibrio barjaei TaxID=1676683 RepID=UPI002283F9BB|nr:hypothetical protein [Vibrio barjaei]MCY9870386.1 hypothetical protein [Vibrio barjaei]